MIDPRMSRFWRLVLQSGLIDERGLSECWESIPPERRDSIEQIDRRLARQAIQLNLITLWQAQQLLAGRFNGFKVGRYILMDLIGQGGMGRVYLAKDTRLGRTVALKILSADRMKNPRAIARFQREAKVGAQLQHENLVRIYDFGESEGRHFLVMEYIEGRTIGALISQQGPIPGPVAAGLGRQIALGLEHIHKKGLVHRDVNPYNILVTYDGTAKLADLGLALDLADEDRFTRDGATVGTFDYVAPEQARHSHSADIRSDIYSLGCTLYHMIAAEVPFPTASLPEKLYAHQSVEPTPLNQIIPGLPEGLTQGIGRMMRKSPDERFPTPLQVVQMLEPFAEQAFQADIGGAAVRSREEIRPGPEAKTMMIPRHTPGAEKDPSAVAEPAISGNPTAESAPPSWNFGPPSGPRGAMTQASLGHVAVGEHDLPLMLDLGPEPSLSEILAESRTLPRSRTASSSISGIWFPRGRALELWHYFRILIFWPMLLVGSILVVVILWLIRPVPESPRSGTSPRIAAPSNDAGKKKEVDPVPPGSGTPLEAKREVAPSVDLAQAPIVVRSYNGNTPDIPASNLPEAINRALGSRGMVVLRNSKPLELSNKSVVRVSDLAGKLLIRAEDGFQPVLEITLSQPGPFLRCGQENTLELEGLTVRAKITAPAPKPVPAGREPLPTTIIQAAGPLIVRRCDFKVSESNSDHTLGAIFCDGRDLTVERSRFEGFDRPIELRMYRKLVATIRQTMIIPGPKPSRGQWGFKISHFSSKSPTKEAVNLLLSLDHCSFRGTGLLMMSGFSGQAPLQVKMSDCVVQADALIDWNPKDGDPVWSRRAVPWSGRGNLYEILGRSLILHEASPSPSAADTIADVGSWMRQVEEKPSTADSVQGADPALIGPSSSAGR